LNKTPFSNVNLSQTSTTTKHNKVFFILSLEFNKREENLSVLFEPELSFKRKVRQTLLLLYSTNPLYLPFSYFQSNFTPKTENGNVTKKKKKSGSSIVAHIIQSLNNEILIA
jgi:hypothetical protein